jgi:hypothetical protein
LQNEAEKAKEVFKVKKLKLANEHKKRLQIIKN